MYTQPFLLFLLLLQWVHIPGSTAVNSARLLIIGDMGGINDFPYSTFVERSTAGEMAKIADLYKAQAILELGDNFYYHGVENVNDPRFSTTFESVYFNKSLFVPWYIIAGNHDHRGNVSAQIDYSNYSTRWNFPYHFYYREFKIGKTSKTVGIVFMDTILMCGMTDHDDDPGQPQPIENDEAREKYWDVVKMLLRLSKANYLFTAGHYPVYSIGYHGPTECLAKDLQPLLKQYKANGHLAGHDHNLQHLKVITNKGRSLDYFVSGMANFVDPSTENRHKVPQGSLQFHNADEHTRGGFLYAEATDKNMTFTFLSANGKVLYSTNVKPRF